MIKLNGLLYIHAEQTHRIEGDFGSKSILLVFADGSRYVKFVPQKSMDYWMSEEYAIKRLEYKYRISKLPLDLPSYAAFMKEQAVRLTEEEAFAQEVKLFAMAVEREQCNPRKEG